MPRRDPYTDKSGVLLNRLEISDPDELAECESDFAYFRVVELELNPIIGDFDFAHLRAIHRHILQDLYDWAGELRTWDTGAFGIPHARPQFLRNELDRVFRQIAARPPSTTDRDAAAAHAARYMSVVGRSDYLADQLRHAVHRAADVPVAGLSSTQGHRSRTSAAAHFTAMKAHNAAGDSDPYHGPDQPPAV